MCWNLLLRPTSIFGSFHRKSQNGMKWPLGRIFLDFLSSKWISANQARVFTKFPNQAFQMEVFHAMDIRQISC